MIPALKSCRQGDQKFKFILGYKEFEASLGIDTLSKKKMCGGEPCFTLKTSRETCLIPVWVFGGKLKKDQAFNGRKNNQACLKKPYNCILFYSPKFTYERICNLEIFTYIVLKEVMQVGLNETSVLSMRMPPFKLLVREVQETPEAMLLLLFASQRLLMTPCT